MIRRQPCRLAIAGKRCTQVAFNLPNFVPAIYLRQWRGFNWCDHGRQIGYGEVMPKPVIKPGQNKSAGRKQSLPSAPRQQHETSAGASAKHGYFGSADHAGVEHGFEDFTLSVAWVGNPRGGWLPRASMQRSKPSPRRCSDSFASFSCTQPTCAKPVIPACVGSRTSERFLARGTDATSDSSAGHFSCFIPYCP